MNKAAVEKFAVWARQKLIDDITYKAGTLGITENGIAQKLPQSTNDLHFFDIGTKKYEEVSGNEIKQRDALINAVHKREQSFRSYKEAFDNLVEEVAYTWFNRLIAIRFMEVNNYLPSGVRVLSSENQAKNEPDFVTSPFDTDLEFTPYEQDRIIQLKDDNKSDELFRMLFIKQCNKLNEILPELFEKTDDYSELLLTISFTDKDGIVYRLTHDISEDDFNVAKEGQEEIIGWLYQYYNTALKADTFAQLKKNVKISKERIPAATQLFTPHWIVRYMVENSLGRIVISEQCSADSESERIEKEKSTAESFGWKYYIPEAEQTPEVRAKLNTVRSPLNADFNIESITLIDPCMGSGHILTYAFDVLMQIYESRGYTQRDAAKLIVENNLFGLDIDKRAYQLAYFAVMMKARRYNRRILNGAVKHNLYYIRDNRVFTPEIIDFIAAENSGIKADLQTILSELQNADEYGSLVNISPANFGKIISRIEEIKNSDYDLLETINKNITVEDVLPVIRQAEIMAQKYDVVVTNPPYMGSSGMGAKLSDYVKKNYPDSKSDLFACFIEHCGDMLKENGYQAMITQHAWMFLSSYENLRVKLQSRDTVNMAHLGARAFEEIGGEVVQTTSFVMQKSSVNNFKGTYCRLIEPTTQQGKEDMFLAGENRYIAIQSNFSKIPGSPIAYWVSNNFMRVFENGKPIGEMAVARNGMKTGDNEQFLRLWWEVNDNKTLYNALSYDEAISSVKKWFSYNKGGSFRKWYGNNDYVVNWENKGYKIFKCAKQDKRNVQDYPADFKFKPSLSWSLITSSKPSFRYKEGNLSDIAGMSVFANKKLVIKFLALLNSPFAFEVLMLIAPTINFQAGDIARVPYLNEITVKNEIDTLTYSNIELSKNDWDSFETSWDFKRHPLL